MTEIELESQNGKNLGTRLSYFVNGTLFHRSTVETN